MVTSRRINEALNIIKFYIQWLLLSKQNTLPRKEYSHQKQKELSINSPTKTG